MNDFSLSKDTLITYIKELAKLLKKNHSQKCELVLVGGSSILLNYTYRMSTVDIDCYDVQGVLMNDLIDQITSKYSLPEGWINTDFINTPSFTNKLVLYSSYYATFSNVLEIRTIKDEYLIAMKMKSARNYKHDLSDICGIISEITKKQDTEININKIRKAVHDLYGDEHAVREDMYSLVSKILINPSIYDEMIEFEKRNKISLKKINL